jgi:hypothetical protein
LTSNSWESCQDAFHNWNFRGLGSAYIAYFIKI